jgi:hypothetical protein
MAASTNVVTGQIQISLSFTGSGSYYTQASPWSNRSSIWGAQTTTSSSGSSRSSLSTSSSLSSSSQSVLTSLSAAAKENHYDNRIINDILGIKPEVLSEEEQTAIAIQLSADEAKKQEKELKTSKGGSGSVTRLGRPPERR